LLVAASVSAADLAGRMREGGVEWLIGKWAAETDSGGMLKLSYEWGVQPSLVVSRFKSDDDESMAMIYFDENDRKVRHFAVGQSVSGHPKGTTCGRNRAEAKSPTLKHGRTVAGPRKRAYPPPSWPTCSRCKNKIR
jgi:hypothetical protein